MGFRAKFKDYIFIWV